MFVSDAHCATWLELTRHGSVEVVGSLESVTIYVFSKILVF